jgi:Fe2+ transport system protein FeoA
VVFDEAQQIYSVLAEDYPIHKRPAVVVLLTQVMGDKIIIREDNTDRPLMRHLMQMGIPREQIICAYAGEPYPLEPLEKSS